MKLKKLNLFFPAWKRYFFLLKTWEGIKENRGQEPLADVEEVVFI